MKEKKHKRIIKRLWLISLIILFSVLSVILIYLLLEYSNPKLVLIGDEVITISYNETYVEPGVTSKGIKDFKEENIVTSSNLDTSKIGTYEVIYTYLENNKTISTKRIIHVVDKEKPVITLNGNNVIEINALSEYKEEGFKAIDEYDGDLTKDVLVNGSIDTSKVGEYSLVYTVTDSSNNTSSITRTIIVIDKVFPTLELAEGKMFIKVNTTYEEAGYKAIDNLDGDITDKVVVTKAIDMSKVGSQFIEYSITDSAGNTTTATRRVNVYEEVEKKNVYLTFDDGPSSLTPEILAVLKEKNVKATFFVSPNKGYYKYLKDIVNDGHEIAIHGYHEYKKIYASSDDFLEYFYSFQNTIYEETGLLVKNFRFPGGSNTVYLKRSVFDEINTEFKKNGIVYYDWNVDSKDASGKSMDESAISTTVINQVMQSSRKENVVLMHDAANKKSTKDSLSTIIDTFLEAGYEFKTINECSFAPQFRS